MLAIVLVLAGVPAEAEHLSKTAFDATYANAQLGYTLRILYDGDRYVRTSSTYGGRLKGVLQDTQSFFDLKLKTASLLTTGAGARIMETPFSTFMLIKQFFLDWKKSPPAPNAKPLGTQEINGHQCRGWAVQLSCPMDVWVDGQTGSIIREVDHAAAGDVVTERISYAAKKYGVEAYTGRKSN